MWKINSSSSCFTELSLQYHQEIWYHDPEEDTKIHRCSSSLYEMALHVHGFHIQGFTLWIKFSGDWRTHRKRRLTVFKWFVLNCSVCVCVCVCERGLYECASAAGQWEGWEERAGISGAKLLSGSRGARFQSPPRVSLQATGELRLPLAPEPGSMAWGRGPLGGLGTHCVPLGWAGTAPSSQAMPRPPPCVQECRWEFLWWRSGNELD